jgi:ABC-type molybdenum transport system ATPase subunit/photorepair protein PhrA
MVGCHHKKKIPEETAKANVKQGSGKTTLLSLILGDHPFSYTASVTLFGKHRSDMATYDIQRLTGHASPELNNSFPRRYGPQGLTARESVVTGFDSVFTYRKPTEEQSRRVDELIDAFGLGPDFADKLYAELTISEQALVLLLRAFAKKPKLLILDEPFAGMDAETVQKAKQFIDSGLDDDQALVMISHYEEELPESVDRVLRLEAGKIIEHV